MPVLLTGNQDTMALEVVASLLSYAIVDDRWRAEEAFYDFGYVSTDEDAKIPLHGLSPLRFEEFVDLFDLFPFAGIEAAISNGIFGTRIGRDLDSPGMSVGIYSNDRGAQLLNNALEGSAVLRRFPIKAVATPNGISFSQASIASGGGSVSPINGSVTGTMGAWLAEKSLGLLGISNNHVICEFNNYSRGVAVIQPGTGDGGSSNDVIGHIEDFVHLQDYNATLPTTTVNTADVAWCRPVRNVSKNIGNPSITPTGECDIDHDITMSSTPIDVCVYGKHSKWMQGQAVAIAKSIWMTGNPYSSGRYRFRDQIELKLDKVAHGDSGSIVMRKSDNKIGGILFAVGSTEGMAYASPWSEVRRCSRLQFNYP